MRCDDVQIGIIENNLGYKLHKWYKEELKSPMFDDDCEEILHDYKSLNAVNGEINKHGAWGCKWEKWYWVIGGDGCGGLYFISLMTDYSDLVYFIDHEDPPIDINDKKHITVYKVNEFVKMICDGYVQYHNQCLHEISKIINRKWYQLWISRRVPDWVVKESNRDIRKYVANK